MQRIPLTAHAECVDGPCGELAGLVTTPGHPIERLVPRVRVDPAATHGIHLDCTRAELGKMQAA